MDYLKARDNALRRLQSELSPNLSYHGLHHTLKVCTRVEALADAENIQGKELTLLQTAAVYHDIGFVEQYQGHEAIGCRIVEETLPQFGYSDSEIEIIQRIIQATQVPQSPQNLLEKIMCDADLDYLGSTDFFKVADTLRREWEAYGFLSSPQEWQRLQIELLENHQYFTSTAKAQRGPLKKKHLEALKALQ